MLFFVDETWQRVGGQDVGALGGVAIPRASYNAFCREVWAIKQNVLGANSLSDCEIKGNNCFAKSAFRKRAASGHSKLLQAAEETLAAIPKYGGYAFAIWTTHERWMMLRNPDANSLSPVYRELLVDFRRCVRRAGGQGLLFFDNRGRSEDMSAACAIQNFLVRVNRNWQRYFVQTPHFTISAVSPGLQAADLIAYLAAHRNDPTVRPELRAYWNAVESIAFRGQRLALRAVNGH